MVKQERRLWEMVENGVRLNKTTLNYELSKPLTLTWGVSSTKTRRTKAKERPWTGHPDHHRVDLFTLRFNRVFPVPFYNKATSIAGL